MITPEIKSKISTLWDKFWSGGIANPLSAIEQITYLLFIKQLDENDKQRIDNADHLSQRYKSVFTGKFLPPGEKEENAIDKELLRWSNFTALPSDEMLVFVQAKVFPFIKQLDEKNSFFTKHMSNAALLIPTGRLLQDAVKIIDEVYSELKRENRFIDAQGDFYEYLLNSLKQAGKNGQFRTPTHIIELISELVGPKLGDKIADPASGTAGFLLGAYKYILTTLTSDQYKQPDDNGFIRGTLADRLVKKNDKKILNEKTFYGFDIDLTMIRIGLMNLMMHGINQPNIDYKDTLSESYNEDNTYDIVMANPPFTGKIDKEQLNKTFTVSTTKSELLFVERIYKMLRVGGTAGVVVPQGVLFGTNKAFTDLRKILIDKCELKAVISLPGGVFKPYAGVASAILIFTKGGETKKVWFYEMESDGWTLDDKRNPLYNSDGSRNFGDLHSIVTEFKLRTTKTKYNRTNKYFTVPKAEIISKNYDLSINKYQEEIYDDVAYEDPQIIISKISELEKNIFDNIQKLQNIIK